MSQREINIGFIRVAEADIWGNIGIGRNFQMGVYTTLNVNQGFGIESSDGSIYISPKGKVDDSDVLDFNHFNEVRRK